MCRKTAENVIKSVENSGLVKGMGMLPAHVEKLEKKQCIWLYVWAATLGKRPYVSILNLTPAVVPVCVQYPEGATPHPRAPDWAVSCVI